MDLGGGEARQLGELVVLRPVVGDEQRQRLLRVGVGGAPEVDVDPRGAAAGRGDRDQLPVDGRGVEPRRRLVGREQQHRLVAERAGRAVRVVGVEHVLAAAVVVDDLELVLEPLDRRVELQAPLAVVAREARAAADRTAGARRRSARRGRRGGRAPPDDDAQSSTGPQYGPSWGRSLRLKICGSALHRVERVEHVEHLGEERRRRAVLGVERRALAAAVVELGVQHLVLVGAPAGATLLVLRAVAIGELECSAACMRSPEPRMFLAKLAIERSGRPDSVAARVICTP